jgi:protein-S-isoprenylcysteine O-methyltransferase Ste14
LAGWQHGVVEANAPEGSEMKKSVEEMTREELVAALPMRLLAMVIGLAALFAVAINLAFITIATEMSLPWLIGTLGVVLLSPIAVSRMFAWTIAPAKERLRRRRIMMREALATVTWSNGDHDV